MGEFDLIDLSKKIEETSKEMDSEPEKESQLISSLVIFEIFDFLEVEQIVFLEQLSKSISKYVIPKFRKWSQRKIFKNNGLKPDQLAIGAVFENCPQIYKMSRNKLEWDAGH